MTHLSLFTGIGGFDLGFELARIETVAQVENNRFCLQVLRTRWPEVPRYEDIRDFDGREYRGVGVISGGDPCQGNSNASNIHQTAAATWGGEFIRVVAESEPEWVIRENPTTVRRDAAWPATRFAACLEELGYSCLICDLQCAALTGFSRLRTFVVGGGPGGIASFRRLLPEQPSNARNSQANEAPRAVLGCLTCHPRRYDTRDNYVVEDTGYIRVLDRHERLRAQGFPADWLPEGSSFRQVAAVTGNAVPVQVAHWFGCRLVAVNGGPV